MATGGGQSLRSLCECPICFEPYTEPRLLQCGHQFCEGCLKDIASHHPHKQVPCPVCRDVTKVKGGNVTNLPRSVLHQYMQELIFQSKEEALGQTCTKCKTERPTRHCPDCKADLAYLCDRCYVIHQKVPRFANHNTVAFDQKLVCSVHPHKMVECFCHDCGKVVCDECLFETHGDHHIDSLKDVAETSRQTLRDYISQHEDQVIDSEIISKLRGSLQVLDDCKTTMKGKVDRVRQAMRTFEKKLDTTVQTMFSQVENEVSKVENFQAKLSDVATAQDKMINLAGSLLVDVADPQVILGAQNLPRPDCDISDITIRTPLVGSHLDKIARDIQALQSGLDVQYNTVTLPVKRGAAGVNAAAEMNLKLLRTIQCKHAVFSLRFDPITRNILTRARDTHELVRVYSTEGAAVNMLGKDGPASPYQDSFFREVATDTKRNLHLLPCVNGALLRIDAAGKVKDTTVLGSNLFGVAYLEQRDEYVISDCSGGESKVFFVQPATMEIARNLGVRGTFSDPRNICVGVINGVATIVIVDKGRNTIDLYSPKGKLIHTFGPSIPGQEPLRGPRGAAVDPWGRVLVADYVLPRVLRVWADRDGEHWECLLGKGEFDHQPWCLDVDPSKRLLAVKGENKIQLYQF